MEQFRHIGEVVGGLNALMVFQEEIQINQRQCCLLVDMINHAYTTIAEEMKQNLRFQEKNTKWKSLESPFRELFRVIKEAEHFIRQCSEPRDWWAKAISLYQNTDCIEFHVHNLLSCFPIVIEAIENVGEISGFDQDDLQRKRVLYSLKYHKDCKDVKVFQWRLGKQYLILDDFCNRLQSVWDEDRWLLRRSLLSRKGTKHENCLSEILLKNLDENAKMEDKILPSSTLVSSKDYQVRRRLGNGSQYKEIQWLGESFALRHFFGDIEPLIEAISEELSLSHPNIMHIFCAFSDEERKECFLVMELMNRDLSSYIKEISGPKKRVPFSLPVAVDIMLQIARGMEYLHSKNIFHGDLNPWNIFVKSRSLNTEGYVRVKVCKFGPGLGNAAKKAQPEPEAIWYAPEILADQDLTESCERKYTEKADVYSFGMICFELLTGKVPFEDSHLQGDKMSRNIRTGERPLFPFYSPKYLTTLTKKCWQNDPNLRPSFTSICRILRCIKKFLILNPESGNPETPLPSVDYSEMEAGMLKSFPTWGNPRYPQPITQIPFQMFLFRMAEKDRRLSLGQRETSESGSDASASACGDDTVISDDPLPPPSPSESLPRRSSSAKKLSDVKPAKQPGTPKGRVRPPPMMSPRVRTMRMNSESQLMIMSPRRMNSESQLMIMSPRRRLSAGHVSDSELS